MADSIPSNGDPGANVLASPRRKAFAVALIALVALTAIWWAGHLWYRRTLLVEVRGDVLARLDPYGNAFTIDLRRRFDLIYGLAAWVSIHNQSMENFAAILEPFARQLRERVAGVRNLNVAPGGIVTYVYPRAGNEAIIGYDLVNDTRVEVREEIARAIKSRKIVISGPFELVVGGFGAVARLAIFRDEKFWGLINVVLDIPTVLAESGITNEKNLQLALKDARGRVVFGAPAVFDADPVVHRVDLPDGHWDLAAIPIKGWSAATVRHLRIFDIGALTIALLLGAVAYLLVFRAERLNARVLERTRALDAELLHRKTIETQLRATEERYRALVDLNPDAVFVGLHEQIIYANPAAMQMFGAKSLHELLGRPLFDLIDPSERGEAEKRYRRAMESSAPYQTIIQRGVRLDGALIHVETMAAPVTWEGSTAVQVIMRDLSEQRKVERSLRTLIDATQDAVICIDRQSRIVMFNRAAERIFGYSGAEVAGKNVNMLMPEPYRSEHDGYIARYESTGEARAIGLIRTVTARRKSGQSFPIELSVTQIASGGDISYTAFIRDISEKMKLQEQAVENQRLATIGTMAAKFGHELGNPLNGMSLTIQLLEQRLKRPLLLLDDQTVATLTRLKSEISRLNTLLQDFRSLSRKETYHFQLTSLRAVVSDTMEIEVPRYLEQGVKVESNFSSDLPPVKLDIDKMKQVILNLAKNAVEAMPQGGKISFRGEASDGAVTLDISDTGTGIPPDVDIFEPFYTSKSLGTGIGLTIVQQIVVAHGGSITYRSEQGKGTTFSISLPLA